MNVLYITHYAGFYGANRSLLRLILELRDDYGVNPLVILPTKGLFVNELAKNDVAYKIFRFYNWQNIGSSWLKSYSKHLLNTYFFRAIATDLGKCEFTADLIHTNSSITNLGGFLSKAMSLPHIWHIREFGLLDFNAEYTRGIKKAGKYYDKNATVIVAISKRLKQYYADYISSQKIEVIYNGVLIDRNFEKQYAAAQKPLKLCFVGVVTENKNQMEAILACEHLIKVKKVTDFVLQIVGDGPDAYYPSLKSYVAKNQLEEHVEFLGYVKEIGSVLQNSDLGIVCSRNEAFGRVTVEFMAHKIPVIATNAGANPEIIEHGHDGYLYDLGNPIHLADYIQKLIEDRSLLADMGHQAHNSALQKFTSEKNTKKLFELYERVLIARS